MKDAQPSELSNVQYPQYNLIQWRHLLSHSALMFVLNKKIMGYNYDLLDFLAEGFLEKGASVTYKTLSGIPALKVAAEGEPSRIYIIPQEDPSKMTFSEELISEEIIIPVLNFEEELRLKTILAKENVENIRISRLSLPQCQESGEETCGI